MRVVCAPRLRALPPQGASQSSSPTRSLPPACGSQGRGGGEEAEGGREPGVGGWGRGAKKRRAGLRRRGTPAALTVWPACPCAGREPTDGAGRRPCPAGCASGGGRSSVARGRRTGGRRQLPPSLLPGAWGPRGVGCGPEPPPPPQQQPRGPARARPAVGEDSADPQPRAGPPLPAA